MRLAFVATVDKPVAVTGQIRIITTYLRTSEFQKFGNKHPDAKNFILISMSTSTEDGTHETFQQSQLTFKHLSRRGTDDCIPG